MHLSQKPVQSVRTSTIVLVAFSTLFFSRTLDALGAPSLINFAHFIFIPLACLLALFNTKTRDRRQISMIWVLLSALSLFFIVNLTSAIINGAGFINVIANFLLLAEPFLILIAITCIPLTAERIQKIKTWVAIFALYNLALAYIQRYALGESNPDFIYGAFFSVAGATVSAIVSLVFSTYYLTNETNKPLWLRLGLLCVALWQIIISDTKLVLGSFIIGFIFFSLSKVNAKTIIYIIFGAFFIGFFFWGLDNIPTLEPYAIWIKPELLTDLDSEFYRAKLKAFSTIPQYYDSFLDPLFGIGPGHGIGRLGGWMMEKYQSLLDPLGATHPYLGLPTEIMKAAARESRNVLGTAMYGPLFSWAGIWSELGIVGLLSYLLIWLVVWRDYCLHDFSRFLVMATLSLGLFPGYLEEPASMIFTTFLIGLWWHEKRAGSHKTTLPLQVNFTLKELEQPENSLDSSS